MSSAVISTTAAQGRFFVFDAEMQPEACPGAFPAKGMRTAGSEHSALGIQLEPARAGVLYSAIDNQKSKILSCMTPASRLAARPVPEMVTSGIAAIDAITGGLPRGCLTEIFGPASSGRTTLLLAAVTAATQRGEFCAVIDAGDALDPQSAADAGVHLERLLWVRCGRVSPQRHPSASLRTCPEPVEGAGSSTEKKDKRANSHSSKHSLEQLLRAADLLLESGGFGLIVLDLADLALQTARRIPQTTWFRFRRAVEYTPTVLLAIERQSIAGSCSSLLIKLGTNHQLQRNTVSVTHAQLLTELKITAEVVRSRMERKPVRPAEITFACKTAWAG